MKCSQIGKWDMRQPHASGTSRINSEGNGSDNEDSPSLHLSDELDRPQNSNYDQLLRTAIISILVFWVFIALGAGIYDPES